MEAQTTRAAIEAAAQGVGRIIFGDVTAELMKMTVDKHEQVVLWLSRNDIQKFADIEPGDDITVNFTSNGEQYRFTSRVTVQTLGAAVVQVHSTVIIQITIEMPERIVDRSKHHREALRLAASPTTDTRHDVMIAALASSIGLLVIIWTIVTIFLPIIGIHVL